MDAYPPGARPLCKPEWTGQEGDGFTRATEDDGGVLRWYWPPTRFRPFYHHAVTMTTVVVLRAGTIAVVLAQHGSKLAVRST